MYLPLSNLKKGIGHSDNDITQFQTVLEQYLGVQFLLSGLISPDCPLPPAQDTGQSPTRPGQCFAAGVHLSGAGQGYPGCWLTAVSN